MVTYVTILLNTSMVKCEQVCTWETSDKLLALSDRSLRPTQVLANRLSSKTKMEARGLCLAELLMKLRFFPEITNT